MTTTTDRQDFQRALDMERGLLAGAAQRSEPHPLGVLLFDDARPRVWVHNQLHVTGPAGDIDDLVRILDEHYGGLQHRRVVVEDEVEGERLADGFRDRGWEVDTTVYMALREPRDREPDASLAAEVSAEEQRAVERRTLSQEPFAKDPEVREMLVDARAARQATVDECRSSEAWPTAGTSATRPSTSKATSPRSRTWRRCGPTAVAVSPARWSHSRPTSPASPTPT